MGPVQGALEKSPTSFLTLSFGTCLIPVFLIQKNHWFQRRLPFCCPPPGDPPQAAAWLGQCGVYLLIMVLEKGVISLTLLVPGWSKVRILLSLLHAADDPVNVVSCPPAAGGVAKLHR